MREETVCRTEEELRRDYLVLQELDDFMEENHIDPALKFILRLQRRNFLTTEQIKDDLVPVAAHAKVCKDNPSIIWCFRNKTLVTVTTVSGISFFVIILYRIVEYFVGFGDLVAKFLVP